MTDEEKKAELAPDMLDEVNGGLLYRSINEDYKENEEDEDAENDEETGTNKVAKHSRSLGRMPKRIL